MPMTRSSQCAADSVQQSIAGPARLLI